VSVDTQTEARETGPTGPDGATDPEADGAPGPDADLSHGELFDLLANRRRRFALHYLKREAGPVEMGELSSHVAAWERGVAPEQVSYDERKTVHTSLYQHHAPRLDDAGLVEYDARRGEVRLTERGADMDVYLDAVRGRTVSWATYFVGLAGLAVALTAGVWLGAVPTGLLDAAGLGAVVSAVLVVSATAFAYDAHASRLGSDGPPPEAER
jgi:DNA-binding transcriptional ArsR family regulator